MHVAALPTGRLAARDPAEIGIYLDKVREFELSQLELFNSYTIDHRRWQKHILHFAGGDNANENQRFRGYLSGYQDFIEDSLYAGKTYLFSKTSGNVIEQLNTDSVRLLIEQGPALMTFFGHASGNSFDLSVDDPSLWNNRGKYPLVIANSCFTGNIHLPVDAVGSISEQYVFTPNEGAIAFMATPDLSFETSLNTYTRAFYRHLSRTNYGQSIGVQMRAAADDMPVDDMNITIAYEMALHGDPALKLYPHAKSEFTIQDPVHGPAIRMIPSNVTTDLDSFQVEIELTNLGRGTKRPFVVSANRTLPDGSVQRLNQSLTGMNFEETVLFTFPTEPTKAVGANDLEIRVDLPLDLVDEYIESSNNTIASHSFFISSTDIYPVVPYNFAVVPDHNVHLKANTGSPFVKSTAYLLQVDTTDRYNGLKKSTTITQEGAVVSWDPDLSSLGLPDSTVYFWRVAPSNDTSKWQEFSFQVISGQHGWGQDHFFQYKNNAFDLIEYERTPRRFDFAEASRDLFVQVIGNSSSVDYNNNYYSLDGQAAPFGEYGIATTSPAMAVVVIDSAELRPWGTYGIGSSGTYENDDKRFGNYNDGPTHRARVEYFFVFRITSPTEISSMITMLDQHVEDGHYVLLYTMLRGLFSDSTKWTSAQLDYLESIGADSIRQAGNLNPYICLLRKGDPASSMENIGSSPDEVLKLNTRLFSNVRLGSMNGPVIGPAMGWDALYMKNRSLDASAGDSVAVTAFALSENGHTSPIDTLHASGMRDLGSTSSDTLPFINLEFYAEDNVFATPSQLRSWHILYDPAPDAAINPIRGFTETFGETFAAGKDIAFGCAIENISPYAFGSFKVHYWMTNSKGELVAEHWLTYDTLPSGGVLFDSVVFSTSSLSGKYSLFMEVNPEGDDWHREQYHFNNRAFGAITVEADEKNPLLDVTFDGIHILNGDIVSPQPMIVMALKDENKVLLMQDTSTFDVYLTQPNGSERRIPFYQAGSEVMVFEPASDQQNKATISYQSEEPFVDGTYALRVMGRDASGNKSGSEDYQIEFEVINKSTVTHVVNYPNPFSSSTRFVFTLTGALIPDVFTIQIMTVTGKVIREITKDELGPIHIGRNISTYAWDGRDEYGDQLANGVYLYRVIMKIDGETIERRNTSADAYFVKEFGKMYLMR